MMAPRTHLARTVLATVRRRGLLSRGDRVVVAVSGGPDSMALLDVLLELREALGVWLCVAHLNHGLRGREAADDAAFTAQRAEALGLAVRVGSVDVAADRARGGGSLEMAARQARYAFLGRVAAELGARRIATGHTADDQVETIVQKLLRGGGLGALCGMPAARSLSAACDAAVVRPLIDATRAEVLAHLAQRGQSYRTDASNADVSFERNAVRHELLPLLEGGGGGLRRTLLRLAGPARELSRIVARQAEGLVTAGSPGAKLSLAALGACPRLVRRAAVAHACVLAGGGPATRGALDAVEGLFAGGSGREVALAGGLVAGRSYGEVWLRRRDGGRGVPPACAVRGAARRVGLDVPGRAAVPWAGLWVEAELLGHRPRRLGGGRWEEVVDLDRACAPLVVRTREAGDRFVPLGLGGSKKLKDFFIDERVPRAERARTLVVEGARGIVWVVGWRLDERARVGPGTRRFARLRAGRLAPQGHEHGLEEP